MPDVVGLLAKRGAIVEVIHAEERLLDLSRLQVEHDLYLLKEKTEIALSLAGALHALGASILNPYPVSTILRDKIATFRVLQAAGLPTPETYAVTHPRALIPLLEAGPLVVKPYRGSRGRGVRVVHTAAGLDAVVPGEEPIFAQRYHPPSGRDRKMYAIGDDVFCVKRVFPATTHEEKIGEPSPVSPELAEITRRCGRALGIDLIGVDIIESGGTPYVVDASSFPGFKGVPDAPLRLARYIYAAAEVGVARHL